MVKIKVDQWRNGRLHSGHIAIIYLILGMIFLFSSLSLFGWIIFTRESMQEFITDLEGGLAYIFYFFLLPFAMLGTLCVWYALRLFRTKWFITDEGLLRSIGKKQTIYAWRNIRSVEFENSSIWFLGHGVGMLEVMGEDFCRKHKHIIRKILKTAVKPARIQCKGSIHRPFTLFSKITVDLTANELEYTKSGQTTLISWPEVESVVFVRAFGPHLTIDSQNLVHISTREQTIELSLDRFALRKSQKLIEKVCRSAVIAYKYPFHVITSKILTPEENLEKLQTIAGSVPRWRYVLLFFVSCIFAAIFGWVAFSQINNPNANEACVSARVLSIIAIDLCIWLVFMGVFLNPILFYIDLKFFRNLKKNIDSMTPGMKFHDRLS